MTWQQAEREYTDEVIGETTLPRLFEDSAARNEDREAQRYKGGVYDRSLVDSALPAAAPGEFRSLTYGELRRIVRTLAAGFRDLGLQPGQRVGIFADTRMEWAQSDLALLAAGGVVTTVYKKSSPDQVRHLLSDSAASGVVVENEDVLERVLAVEDDLSLEFVVVMDLIGPTYASREDVHTLGEVFERGTDAFDREAYDGWLRAIDVDDLATLIYTSGTTGRPKGVMLTHRNIRSNVNQVRKRYGPRPDKAADTPVVDVHTRTVSFLPLAHVFERTAGHFLILASGGCVAYAESPDTLQEDFQLVQPNTATSVPRVYEKIYDAIRTQASESPIKERIFEWAVEVGTGYHRAASPGTGLTLKRRIADALVFGKVKDALGGNIEMLISGGGSLSSDLCALYHGMGLPIFEGYGLTETAPVVTCNPAEEPKIGTIGPALPGVEIRVDASVVEDGEFDAAGGEVGELMVQGENVAQGYWELPDETADAFSEDGWFRTGDVVRIRPDGYVEFIERAKEVLVLSTGMNVAPGPIEDAFASSAVVEQCMVVGDNEKFVGALIVPNTEGLEAWASEQGITLPADPDELRRDPRVRDRVQSEIDRVNRQFERYETIKQFQLVPEEFTEENELLTPTMKKKRRNILDRYADAVDLIYDSDHPEQAVEQ